MLTDRHALTDTQSREQVCVQHPTSADTWHYPHLLLGTAAADSWPSINRSVSPGGRAHSSKHAAAVTCGSWMGQTDGCMHGQQLHKPCSTYYAGSANNEAEMRSIIGRHSSKSSDIAQQTPGT